MTTIQKDLIAREDVKYWRGTSQKTFTRTTSTGGSQTVTMVGNTVDVKGAFGDAFSDLVDAVNIGSTARTIELAPDTYTMTADLTIPSTVGLKIPSGGKIDTGVFTLTINGPFEAGNYQVFGDSITVSFGAGAVKEVYPEWWGNTGSDIEKALAAVGVNGLVRVNPGTYEDVTVAEIDFIHHSLPPSLDSGRCSGGLPICFFPIATYFIILVNILSV